MLLSGVNYTNAITETGEIIHKPATPGEYKKLPNHVLQTDGTIHHYIEPLQVIDEMEILCKEIQDSRLHPLITAAKAHYNMVRIHPFDDGNGRGARILMNLILIKNAYPPAIIRMTERRLYLNTLSQADKGDLKPFYSFIANSLIKTQELILENLKV